MISVGVGATLVWVLAAGCSSDDPLSCEALCARQEGCPDYEADCVAGCEAGQTRAEDLGCGETFDALAACLDAAGDICNHGCGAETGAYVACICPGGDCGEAAGDCSYGTSGSGAGGSCTVIALCGDDVLHLECSGEDVDCDCVDDEGAVVASVPYEAAFCSDDLEIQGAAAAAACNW